MSSHQGSFTFQASVTLTQEEKTGLDDCPCSQIQATSVVNPPLWLTYRTSEVFNSIQKV